MSVARLNSMDFHYIMAKVVGFDRFRAVDLWFLIGLLFGYGSDQSGMGYFAR